MNENVVIRRAIVLGFIILELILIGLFRPGYDIRGVRYTGIRFTGVSYSQVCHTGDRYTSYARVSYARACYSWLRCNWIQLHYNYRRGLTWYFSPEKLYTDKFFFVNRKRAPARRNTFAWSRTVFLKLYNNASTLPLENMSLQCREAYWEWVNTLLSPHGFREEPKSTGD